MIRYAKDLYPRTDPKDGARIVRFGKLQSSEYRGEAWGTGSGRLALRATTSDGALIDPLGLQYVRVVRIDTSIVDAGTLSGYDEKVVGGYFLDSGDFEALSKARTKRLTFGGAGTLSYLDRAAMAPHSYIGDDPFDDIWRLHEQGAGFGTSALGSMFARAVFECMATQADDPGAQSESPHPNANDRLVNAIPALTVDFDGFTDSNGVAWTAWAGEFNVNVGDSLLAIAKRFMDAGVFITLDPDTFVLHAYDPGTHRRDRTGAAWGTDVVRFQVSDDTTWAGGNIKSDAKRAISARIRRSLVWAGGQDIYGVARNPAADVPWEGAFTSDALEEAANNVLAAVQLAARDDAGDTIQLRIKLGNDPDHGKYLPFEDAGVKVDDNASVHSGSGTWEWDELTVPVAALVIRQRKSGAWDAFAELGDVYSSAESRAFSLKSGGSCNCPPTQRLCDPARAGGAASCSLDPSQMTQVSTPNGGFEDGDNGSWVGALTPTHDAGVAPEGEWYMAGTGQAIYRCYTGWVGTTFKAGQTYVLRFYGHTTGARINAYFGSGSTTYPGNADTPPTWSGSGDYEAVKVLNGGDGHLFEDVVCMEWTPSADRTDVYFMITFGDAAIKLDGLQAYTGGVGSNPLHGTEPTAARCDHKHHVLSTSSPTVNDDEDDGYPVGTLWVQVDDVTTPTSITNRWMLLDNSTGAAVWESLGGSSVTLSDNDPLVAAATAAEGTGTEASRDDHVHPVPKLDDLAAPDDNTDLNASTTKHGLLPKLPGGTTTFLRGDGTYATPAGGADDLDDLTDVDLTTDAPADEDVLTYEASTSLWVPKPAASGFSNPMTTEDDIIVGGASGAAGRLGKGTDGQVLTVDPVTHHLAWKTPSGGGGGGSTSEEWWHHDNKPASPSAYDREFTEGTTIGTLTRVANGTPYGTWSERLGGLEWIHTVSGPTANLDVFAQAVAGLAVGDYVTIAARYPPAVGKFFGPAVGFSNGATFGTSNAIGVLVYNEIVGTNRGLLNKWPGFNSRVTDGTNLDAGPSGMVIGWRVKYEAANTWGLYARWPGSSVWRIIQTNYAYTLTPTHVYFGINIFANVSYSANNGNMVRLECFRYND